jgi:hypothetical protein
MALGSVPVKTRTTASHDPAAAVHIRKPGMRYNERRWFTAEEN